MSDDKALRELAERLAARASQVLADELGYKERRWVDCAHEIRDEIEKRFSNDAGLRDLVAERDRLLKREKLLEADLLAVREGRVTLGEAFDVFLQDRENREAQNFVTHTAELPDGERWSLTLQQEDGQTPDDMIRALRAEVETLREAAEQVSRESSPGQSPSMGAIYVLRAALTASAAPSEEPRLCDGCNVRPPWEHRCHGDPCPCACDDPPPVGWDPTAPDAPPEPEREGGG